MKTSSFCSMSTKAMAVVAFLFLAASQAFAQAPRYICTYAGTGVATTGSAFGDGGQATAATFKLPSGIALDERRHKLYIADADNNKIRMIDTRTKIITSIAGSSL